MKKLERYTHLHTERERENREEWKNGRTQD